MNTIIAELPRVIIVSGVTLAGLGISNILFDLEVPHYISRKIGHSAGGVSFLLCGLFFSSALWPIVLATFFSLLLWGARIVRPETFRGVGGSGRGKKVMAEVWFALVAVPVFAVGWLWLNRPFVAVACLLFMAWGDCVTGLIRFKVYGRPVKGLWGSLAMLFVCLAISWTFLKPFWIGAIGSVIAVVTEWAFGDVGIIKWADDNLAIPIISSASILGLLAITGTL